MTPTSKSQPSSGQKSGYHHRNRPVFIPEGVMAVGLIVGAHGLNGELKVELHTDFDQRFTVGNNILIGEKLIEVAIETSRPHKGMQLIHLDGVRNRTQVEKLRGQWLFIPEDDAISLEEDTFWIHDIVGLTVVDTTGRTLGTVRNVLETGANNVYIVQPAAGVNQGKELLLPAIVDVVQEVDLEAGVLHVQLLPGLLNEDDASK